MPYSERAYFEGDHCQHVADRIEHQRIRHRAQKSRQARSARRLIFYR